MSEFSGMDENPANVNQLFADVKDALKRYKRNEAELQNENKALGDENTSLHHTVNRLIGVNGRQQTIIDTYHRSTNEIRQLKIELNNVKQENLLLKSSSKTLIQSEQQSNIEADWEGSNPLPFYSFNRPKYMDKLEKYNSVLQKKIVELEKTIVLQNENAAKRDSSDYICDESKLKMENDSLILENKSLKEQLTNFRHAQNQIVSEIHSNNVKRYSDSSRQANNNAACTTLVTSVMDRDEFDLNELQPLRVNVIDYDVENLTCIYVDEFK